ncbi:COG4223 family protein [Alkalilacustris brevis]|uniref:COG4223 family protein n=1 Tax=Alkalilacustris brevis TaxID=2026338 RepID=UPI000E0DE356|nr:hypothetical protein [Alkalilacustris brevis]
MQEPGGAQSSPAPTDPQAPETGVPGVPPGIDPAIRPDAVVPASRPDDADEAAATEPSQEPAQGSSQEPAPETAAPPAPPAPPRRTFAPLILGGALAAALGFGLAVYMDRTGLWPFGASGEMAAVEEALGNQQERLDATESALAALRDELTTRLDESTTTATGHADAVAAATAETLRAELAQFETRLATLEARPPVPDDLGADIPEEFLQQLTTLRGELAELRDIAEAAQDQARAAQTAIEARAEEEAARQAAAALREALRQIETALADGAPYRTPLNRLAEAGFAAPQALDARANDGVPTLAALQAGFPPAARAALDATRRDLDEDLGLGARILTFLQVQTGARSLAPREGADPDAVLSRAEAALREGALQTALDELGALPDSARPYLTDWEEQARTRVRAIEAFTALAAQIDTL